VFFVHGYGDTVKNHAYLATMFANYGYEFCGMDQCGFGMSEGYRGQIKNKESGLQELDNYHSLYNEKYGDAKTPCFLMGTSLGGLLTAFLSSRHCNFKMKYRGNIQTVPYYDIHESVNLDKLSLILKGLFKMAPNKSFAF
jgi:alpha-beta hydrolase superfamily lysophospholipase